MATNRQLRNKQTLRETVRVLFVNGKLLGLLVLIGAAIGGLRAAMQERTYAGNVELATGGHALSEGVILPNPTQLRRLVLDPDIVAVLESDASKAQRFLEREIRIEPVVTDTDNRTSVWRVNAEVYAPSQQAATEKLNEYVNRLQTAFEKSLGLDIVKAARPKSPAADGQPFHFVAFQPVTPPAETEPAPAAPTADLRERAQKLNVSLNELPEAIDATQKQLEDSQTRQQTIERDLSLLRATARLLEDGARVLPAEVFKKHPELEGLIKQYDELEQRRSQLATQLKPVHPQLRTMDRRLGELGERMKQAQQLALSDYKQQQAEVEQRLQKLLAEQMQQQQRLRDLKALLQARDAEQPKTPDNELAAETKQPASKQGSPSSKAETPGPQDEAPETLVLPPLEPQRLVAGQLLVAGPYVGSEPVRPNVTRDVVLGGCIGLAFGLLWVVVRTRADQRIHAPYHLDQLDLGVEVFGSIPQLRDEAPVRLAAKPKK